LEWFVERAAPTFYFYWLISQKLTFYIIYQHTPLYHSMHL